MLYESLGLDSKNPLQSILESKITDYHDLQGKSCDDNALSPNYTIATLKESFLKTGRLDAEYYQSKYEDIERFIKNYRGGYLRLTDIVEVVNGSFIPEAFYTQKAQRAYIRIKELSLNAPIKISECIYIKDDFIASNEVIVKENDFVIATIGNTIGKVNLVPKELEGSFISNNTSRLRLIDKNYIPEFIELLLRSMFVQEQIQRNFTQTAQPKISNTSLENILIPKIDSTTQESIAKHIQKSFELRTEAKNLLEKAKSEVESALNNANNGGGGGEKGGGDGISFRPAAIKIIPLSAPPPEAAPGHAGPPPAGRTARRGTGTAAGPAGAGGRRRCRGPAAPAPGCCRRS